MEPVAVISPLRLPFGRALKAVRCNAVVPALLLGAFSFTSSALVPLSLLVLTLWAHTHSRWSAFLVGFLYFIGFTHSLPEAVCGYSDSTVAQALLCLLLWWPCAALFFALPFALFWSKKKKWAKAPLLLVALLIPPFGIVGIGHPVLAAGVLFPATGLFGIAVILMISPLYASTYFWVPLIASFVLSMLQGSSHPPAVPTIIALNTHYESTIHRTPSSLTHDWLRPGELRNKLLGIPSTASIVILPEEVAGVFTPELFARWSTIAHETGKTLLVGGDSMRSGTPINSIARFDGTNTDILYTQRQPVPFSMWKPWSESGYPITFTSHSVAPVQGRNLGFLLCYELLIPWTVIQTSMQHPDVIIGATNISYAANTSLYELLELHKKLWAALFGIPFIVAHNR